MNCEPFLGISLPETEFILGYQELAVNISPFIHLGASCWRKWWRMRRLPWRSPVWRRSFGVWQRRTAPWSQSIKSVLSSWKGSALTIERGKTPRDLGQNLRPPDSKLTPGPGTRNKYSASAATVCESANYTESCGFYSCLSHLFEPQTCSYQVVLVIPPSYYTLPVNWVLLCLYMIMHSPSGC